MIASNGRMSEFVAYHINGDGECNNVVLKEWADRKGLDKTHRFELAFFFAITYSVESAVILFENQKGIACCINSWVNENKSKLVFQSDRKYIRMSDRFERCLRFFFSGGASSDDAEGWERDGALALGVAIKKVEQWPMFGRFSAYLFLETYAYLCGLKAKNAYIDWPKGDTATSGLMNVYGLDKAADRFDKTGKIDPGLLAIMDKMQDELLRAIENAGGDTNITNVETSLCAYRKFYKGTRYDGYYLDRMLEEMRRMMSDWPETTKELFAIRASVFDHEKLGEFCGWDGVRSERKKEWLEKAAE